MKRKLTGMVAVVMLVCAAATSADASLMAGDKVKLNTSAPGGQYGGGAFNLTETDGTFLFRTFCVQTNETFKPGKTYDVHSVSTNSEADGNLLDQRTGLVYTQFMKQEDVGGIGFDFTSNSHHNALQQAIWHFQGQGPIGSSPDFSDENQLSALAKSIVDFANTAVANTTWSGLGQVRILNIWDASTGQHAQSQLIMIPEPGSLAIWAMMGLGAIGLTTRRRRNLK